MVSTPRSMNRPSAKPAIHMWYVCMYNVQMAPLLSLLLCSPVYYGTEGKSLLRSISG